MFSNLTGGKSRRDARLANNDATRMLDAGYADARKSYDQAYDLYEPYGASGRQAQGVYDNLLGLNGNDARAQSQGIYSSDPYAQGALNLSQNAMSRALNARGSLGGGKGLLAGERVAQENYGNWMDRYRQQGQQGLQVAGAQSGIRAAQGDMRYNHAATLAGNRINLGNAMAGTRSVGLQNVLNAGGSLFGSAASLGQGQGQSGGRAGVNNIMRLMGGF